MSRSAAATDRHHRVRRAVAVPAGPRRVSGPLNPKRPPRARVDARTLNLPLEDPRRRSLGTRPPLRIAAEGGLSLASAVAGVALEVSHSKLMDRLVRSRGWIVIVAIGLIGIVAMQVSLLKLNAGIGRAIETISSLERSNSALRGEVSRLSSGDRIQSLAGSRGFVMPAPADVTFLKAGSLRSDGYQAAKRMRSPDPSIAGPAGAPIAPNALDPLNRPADAAAPGAAGIPGAAGAGATAPGATAPASTTPGAAAPAGTTPGATVPGSPAPGTTGPAPTAPATTAAGAAAPITAAAPVANGAAATSPAGGVSPQPAP